MGTVFYLNVDFDLSLRSRPRRLQHPSLQKAVQAMTVHGMLLGGPGDALLTRAGIPGSFVEYLGRAGIESPRLLRHSGIAREMHFCPFGWNAETISINAGQENPARHPGLGVVRIVNSRTFSTELERTYFPGNNAGRSFTSRAALAEWLEKGEVPGDGWVVKAEHGNAGLGNRRLRSRQLSVADRRFIDELLAEDERVTVESWRRRLLDLCVVFRLGRGGETEGLRWHETIYTRDGALIGAIFEPGFQGWRERIEGATEVIAGELSRRGYFGPVCYDAFVYSDDGREHLRPLVDLNCRRPMSDVVFRLWRERLSDRVLYWRFFNTQKLRPEAEAEITAGEDHYRSDRRGGILLTSPLTIELEGLSQRAPKLAVAFVGEDRAEVLAMEGAFRARWER